MSRAKYLGIAVGIARQPMALSWEEVVDGDPRVVVPSLHPIVLSGLSVDFYHDSVKTIVHIPDHTWSYQNHAMQHILQHICSSQHANQGSFYIILPLWLATRNQVTEGRFFQPNTHHTTTKPSHFGGVLSITMENPLKIHRKSLSFQWKKNKKRRMLPGSFQVGRLGPPAGTARWQSPRSSQLAYPLFQRCQHQPAAMPWVATIWP